MRHHLAYFESGRIKTGAEWTKAISKAIQGCTVFLSVVTPKFLESNRFLIEGGAALCANKKMYFCSGMSRRRTSRLRLKSIPGDPHRHRAADQRGHCRIATHRPTEATQVDGG